MAVETVGGFYIAADFSSWLVGFADVSFPPPEEEPPPPQPVSIMIAAASTNKNKPIRFVRWGVIH